MSTVMINEIMERHIKSICNEYASYVVEKLSSKYAFDAEEAMRELELPTIKRAEPRKAPAPAAEKKTKSVKAPVPTIPLPFCGQVIDGWCKAIVKNNKLYTQCTNSPTKDELCTKCDKLLKKDGELPFGLINSRMECDIFSYKDAKGNAPVPYTVIMAKMDITREKAIEEATKFGITIQEEHFAAVEKARGRPKKDVAEKSDDETDKKNRGRPKKDKPVKATSKVGDDIIAGLLQQAKDNGEMVEEKSSQSQDDTTQEDETSDKEVEKNAPKANKANKTDKTAAKAAKEAEKVAAKAAKEAEKAAAKAAKEAEKEAKAAAKKNNPKEKKAPAPKKDDKPAPKVDEQQGASETKSCEQEKYSDEEEEEEEEEPIKVKKFEFEGKKYKRSEPDNILYDWENDEPVGVWNPNTKTIDQLPEDSDEEDDE